MAAGLVNFTMGGMQQIFRVGIGSGFDHGLASILLDPNVKEQTTR